MLRISGESVSNHHGAWHMSQYSLSKIKPNKSRLWSGTLSLSHCKYAQNQRGKRFKSSWCMAHESVLFKQDQTQQIKIVIRNAIVVSLQICSESAGKAFQIIMVHGAWVSTLQARSNQTNQDCDQERYRCLTANMLRISGESVSNHHGAWRMSQYSLSKIKPNKSRLWSGTLSLSHCKYAQNQRGKRFKSSWCMAHESVLFKQDQTKQIKIVIRNAIVVSLQICSESAGKAFQIIMVHGAWVSTL